MFGAAVADLWETGTYFRTRPDLARLALVAALLNLAFSMCVTILPIWAVAPGRLGLSEGAYGLLFGAVAVGGLVSSVFAGRVLRRFGDPAVIRWVGLFLGLNYLAIAIPSAPVAFLALACGGAASMLWNIAVVTYRQTTIPREVFGRVIAAYRWVTWGVLPLGSLLAGVIAGLAGTVWVFVVAGLLPLTGGLQLALRWLPLPEPATGPATARADRAPETTSRPDRVASTAGRAAGRAHSSRES